MKGNKKLTLGLIWSIILRFQMETIMNSTADKNVKKAILELVNSYVLEYIPDPVKNLTSSWYDGTLLAYLIYHQNKSEINISNLLSKTPQERIQFVFDFASKNYQVDYLLEAEDLASSKADEQSIMTYLSSLCASLESYKKKQVKID
ncbi:alpha-actinin-like [Octopus sinensis]|uniref:Alpha-actinin-like n=1 Tax=Octopus sinensis TaxID=2607531 RepID=A0A7E6EIG4_9MOLL|nr:alpha-actinin-like [Octopus sinensis]